MTNNEEKEEIMKSEINNESFVGASHNPEDLSIENNIVKESFYRETVLDGKEFTKLVRSSEKMIRQSSEYSSFIFHVKGEIGLSSCAIFGDIGESEEVSIELDHYPFTLFDICAAVMNKHIEEKIPFNTFVISDIVMKLHYDYKIGVVPLSKTIHELRHAGKIFINLSQVYGRYLEFAKEYEKYIDPEVIANLARLMEMSHNKTPFSSDENFLKVRIQDFYSSSLPAPTLTKENENETSV
jgi:hypothetical protein